MCLPKQALQDNYYREALTYLPTPADALQMVLLYKVLSAHAPNEEYLDNPTPEWIQVRARAPVQAAAAGRAGLPFVKRMVILSWPLHSMSWGFVWSRG